MPTTQNDGVAIFVRFSGVKSSFLSRPFLSSSQSRINVSFICRPKGFVGVFPVSVLLGKAVSQSSDKMGFQTNYHGDPSILPSCRGDQE